MTAPAVVATGRISPAHLTPVGDFVYLTDFRDVFVRVPKSGGPVQFLDGASGDPTLDGGPERGFDIAVDAASHIYVSSHGRPDLTDHEGTLSVLDTNNTILRTMSAFSTQGPFDCHLPFIDEIAVAPNGDLYWL